MSNSKKMNFNNNKKGFHRAKNTGQKQIGGDQKKGGEVKGFWAVNIYSREDPDKIEKVEAQTKANLGQSTSGLTLREIKQGRGEILSEKEKVDLYVKAYELNNKIERFDKNKIKNEKNTNIKKELEFDLSSKCQELERVKADLENGFAGRVEDFESSSDINLLGINCFANYNNNGSPVLVKIKSIKDGKYEVVEYETSKIIVCNKSDLKSIKSSELGNKYSTQAKNSYTKMVEEERENIKVILEKYDPSSSPETNFKNKILALKKIDSNNLTYVGELLLNICISDIILSYQSEQSILPEDRRDITINPVSLNKTIAKYVFKIMFEDTYGIQKLITKIRFYNNDNSLGVDGFVEDNFIERINTTYQELGNRIDNSFIRHMLSDHYSMIPPLNRREIILDDFQKDMCDYIDNYKNVILRAPTSSGKTILATHALKNYKRGLTIVVVPNDSDVLSWQTASKIEKDMSNMAREDTKKVIIVNHTFKSVSNMNDKNDKSVCVKGLISKIGGCNVVVGTSKDICDIFPEIVGKVINEQKRKIHYVIFDEIHTINMNEGKEMEHIAKMIGDLNKKSDHKIPFMALSATISNPERLQDWFISIGFDDVKLVTCDERFFNLKLYSTDTSKFGNDCLKDVKPEIVDINPLSLLEFSDFVEVNGIVPISGKDINFTSQDVWELWIKIKEAFDLDDNDQGSPYSYFGNTIRPDVRKMFSLKDVKLYSQHLIQHLVNYANSDNQIEKDTCCTLIESFQPLEIEEHSNIDFYKFFEKLKESRMDPAIVFAINPVACISHAKSFYKQIMELNKEKKTKIEIKKSTIIDTKDEKIKKKQEDKDNREKRKIVSNDDKKSGKTNQVSSQRRAEDEKLGNDKVRQFGSGKKPFNEYKGNDISGSLDLSKYRPSPGVGFLPSSFTIESSDAEVTNDSRALFEKTIQEAANALADSGSWNYTGSGNEPHWLIRLLTFGVGVFIKGIAEPYLRLVQHLASKKELSFVFSDKSMTFGVSMPFRTSVIVRDFYDPDNTMMNPMIYHQASGRAGRRGEDTEGNIVIVGYSWNQIKNLTVTDIPKIEGYPENRLWDTDSVEVLSGGLINPECLRTNFLNEKLNDKTSSDEFFKKTSNLMRYSNMDKSEKYLCRLLWNFRSSYEALVLPFLIEKLLELYTTKSYSVEENQEDVADFICRFINLSFKKYGDKKIGSSSDDLPKEKVEIIQVQNSIFAHRVDEKLTKDDIKKEEVVKVIFKKLRKVGIELDHPNIDTRTIDSIKSGKQGIIDPKSKDSIEIYRFKNIFEEFTSKVVKIQNYFYYVSDKWLELDKDKRAENTPEIRKLSSNKAVAQLLGKLTTRLWYMLRNDPTFKRGDSKEDVFSKVNSSSKVDRSIIEGVVERDFSYNKIENFDSIMSTEFFEEIDVAADGNCLFRAGSVYNNGDESHHQDLRCSVHSFMNTNRNYYEKFVDVNYDDHLDYIVTDGNDVGDYEVHALSNVLNRPIYVVNISTGQIRKEGDNIDVDSPFESEPIVLGLYPEIISGGDVDKRGHYILLKVNWPDDCNYGEFIDLLSKSDCINNMNRFESNDSNQSIKSSDTNDNMNTLSEESQPDEEKSKGLNSMNPNEFTSKNQKNKKKNSKKKNKRSSSSSSR